MAFGAEKGLYVDPIVLFDRTPFAYYFEQNCRNLVISQGKTGVFPYQESENWFFRRGRHEKGGTPQLGNQSIFPQKQR